MKKLFGTSGVRGLVGEEITPELFMDLGLAMATQLGNSGTVLVGRDPRLSGEMLEDSLISGLLSGGCNVIRAGIVPTPVLAYATKALKARAGAMITASHNPPQYNGVKFWDSEGKAYTQELEQEIERIHFGGKGKKVGWDKIGKIGEVDASITYLKKILEERELRREYKVVVDCGNGAASVLTPILLRRLGCKIVTLNCQPDGNFPGRGLEPNAGNLRELCEVVKATGADLGIAHDGDADRVSAVDERGDFAKEDKLLAAIAARGVSKKGDVIVTTVDASRVVDDAVGSKGGKIVRTPVGDVSVAAGIEKQKATFGGEPSGAWIFPDVHMAPDGPLSAVNILELIDSEGKKLSEILDSLPDYPTVRKKIGCGNEKKTKVMKTLATKIKREFRGAKVLKIDGVRLDVEGGWVLIRPSGTEPYIRVTAEGKSQKQARDLVAKAEKILKTLV